MRWFYAIRRTRVAKPTHSYLPLVIGMFCLLFGQASVPIDQARPQV